MVTVEVALPGRSYPVLIGAGALECLPELVARHRRRAVVVDRAVAALGAEVAAGLGAPVMEVEAGEPLKSIGGLVSVLDFLERSEIDRAGCLVAVGGGSVGDVAGFAGAVWMRGVAVYQVPTTLLAMVDSSVGGKTGINSGRGKNMIGAFWQPRAVLADPRTLDTLPAGEVQAAFGEIVKCALAMDAGLLSTLIGSAPALLERSPGRLEPVIARCVELKAGAVVEDELDVSGARAVLNYGHTAGHAIESASGYRLAHGRAVAHGLMIAAALGEAEGLAGPEVAAAHRRALTAFGLPGPVPAEAGLEAVLAGLPRDKKAGGGEPAWVLPVAVGRVTPGHRLPAAIVRRVIGAHLRELA